MQHLRNSSCRRYSVFVCLLAIVLAPEVRAQLVPDFNQFFSQEREDITGGAERGNSFGSSIGAGDFDNDGFADIAVGLPGEDGGSVIVIYGSVDLLTSVGNQRFRQGQDGLPDDSENEDLFGFKVVAGDFNGDDFDDLAIGAPGENTARGAVFVINGSAIGLSGSGSRRWRQGSDDIRDDDDQGDAFGIAMAAGDFDDDGFDDLAIGVRGENGNEGVVNVIYGSGGGLTSNGNQRWRQGNDRDGRLEGGREDNDAFGIAMAAGDFDGDGFDDLAVGVPGENAARGAVNVVYGSSGRLTADGNQRWSQQQEDITGGAERNNRFGNAVDAADYNGDGYDDLAVGMPFEDGGSVIVIYGSSERLVSAGNQRWRQGEAGILDRAESNNRFGGELSSGDFNVDGFADLAIGTAGEDDFQGVVHIIHGSEDALTSEGNQLWRQDISRPEDGDSYGSALAVADYNGDGGDDIAIGVPGENAGKGAVNVIYAGVPVAMTNGASFSLEPVAPESIATLFGINLASGTQNAPPGAGVPNVLLDTSVDVTDSSGVTRPAPLFFIQPTQINLQIPPGTALGPAGVTVNRASGVPFFGTVEIETMGPGIFSANGSGQGVAAARFLRVLNDGSREEDFIFDTNARQSIPIDLGDGEEKVFLLLFGTGIRGVFGNEMITATVGGLKVTVLGAAIQPEFVGLDQVNIGPFDPAIFQGRGEVDLVLTVTDTTTGEDKTTNTVTVNLQ